MLVRQMDALIKGRLPSQPSRRILVCIESFIIIMARQVAARRARRRRPHLGTHPPTDRQRLILTPRSSAIGCSVSQIVGIIVGDELHITCCSPIDRLSVSFHSIWPTSRADLFLFCSDYLCMMMMIRFDSQMQRSVDVNWSH